MDLEAARRELGQRGYDIASHVRQHQFKEGFTAADILNVVQHGRLLEEYPERSRWLLLDQITIEEVELPLHVVLEHSPPERPCVVTAYIPQRPEWLTPTQRSR